MVGYSLFAETMADMSWVQVAAAAERGAELLAPVGVIEQHGPHLPIGTDIYAAYTMCVFIKRELQKHDREVVIAPPYYFGVNSSTYMFPGSINVKRETLMSGLTDCLINYKNFGFNRQFILNHHGDPRHNNAIMEVIRAVRSEGIDAVYVMGGFQQHFITEAYASAFGLPLPLPAEALIMAEESAETREARERLTKSALHCHAEERETSLILKYFPDLLNKEIDFKSLTPIEPSPQEFAAATGGGRWRELSPLGHIGDPAAATPENGELYAYESRDIARAIEQFLTRAYF